MHLKERGLMSYRHESSPQAKLVASPPLGDRWSGNGRRMSPIEFSYNPPYRRWDISTGFGGGAGRDKSQLDIGSESILFGRCAMKA